MKRDVQLLLLALTTMVVACVLPTPGAGARHRWAAGLGAVLPHDSFPADCSTCHAGSAWNELRDDFEYDHFGETGVELRGAHSAAQCLRCHNDRGPVSMFQAKGCIGCHEDFHAGELGPTCTECHTETTWNPVGQISRHNRTRFPLVGVHAGTSCQRCHPGAEVGNFLPADPECVTCHADDLAQTTNHVGLGWVDRCDRCHMPTFWTQAEVNF